MVARVLERVNRPLGAQASLPAQPGKSRPGVMKKPSKDADAIESLKNRKRRTQIQNRAR